MSTICIPRDEWQSFLTSFNRNHYHRFVIIETHDLETNETVTSREMRLRSIDYDLEDLKHPRINVNVEMDNKLIKEILFMPTELKFCMHGGQGEESLHIRSVNTATTVRFPKRTDERGNRRRG